MSTATGERLSGVAILARRDAKLISRRVINHAETASRLAQVLGGTGTPAEVEVRRACKEAIAHAHDLQRTVSDLHDTVQYYVRSKGL